MEQEKAEIIAEAESVQKTLQKETSSLEAELFQVKLEMNAMSSKQNEIFESMITKDDHVRQLEVAKKEGEAALADAKEKLSKSHEIEIHRLERRKRTEMKAIALQVRTMSSSYFLYFFQVY